MSYKQIFYRMLFYGLNMMGIDNHRIHSSTNFGLF